MRCKEEFPTQITNEKGELEFYEGLHDYNPNKVTCPTCNSLNVEFLWNSYTVVGMNCRDCGEQILDK